MKPKPDNGHRDIDPLARHGQEQRNLTPWDFEDPPQRNEGGSLALIVLIVVFLLGMVIGGCLW